MRGGGVETRFPKMMGWLESWLKLLASILRDRYWSLDVQTSLEWVVMAEVILLLRSGTEG